MSDGQTLPLSASDSSSFEEEAVAAEDSPEARLKIALGEDYELGAQIGEGGMGIVYRATDLRLKREVAIKLLPPEVAHRADLRKRFVREAQLSASLTHPNIVPIYDVGHRGGLVWIVMALINGESLRDLVRRSGPQPVHVVARIMREVAWALSYAHARGVIHRDIKPDNIMIERASGRAVVMDFGLAKIDTDGEENLTQPGKVLGTPAYMSPEQARGRETVDHRTDLYSLGMVGYHLLSGRNPFEASTAQAVMARVITEEAPDLAVHRPDAPAWLIEVIRKATLRQPSKRHKHAEELVESLDHGQMPRESPSSVLALLDVVEGYVQFSVLGAWMLWIVGTPKLPTGSGLIFAAFLVMPLFIVLQLFNAEGLEWGDIRNGIVARRIHWLRNLSLQLEAGVHLPSRLIIVITVLGVMLIRWWGTILSYIAIFFGGRYQWTQFDPGPLGTGELLFQGPRWALAYAFLGTFFWARLFGLPLTKHLSPQRLDAIASWQIPKWMDCLGKLLFRRIGSKSKAIEATADFRQLAEPAIRESIAFNRAKRNLRWRDRARFWRYCPLGRMLVKRVWLTYERLVILRERQKSAAKEGSQVSGPEWLAKAIDKRETLLTESAAALSGLRLMLEDAQSPGEEKEGRDPALMAELLRLTTPLRRIRWFNWSCSAFWISMFAVRVLWPHGNFSMQGAVDSALLAFLLALIAFQFYKRRLYI